MRVFFSVFPILTTPYAVAVRKSREFFHVKKEKASRPVLAEAGSTFFPGDEVA
jgi:hypothetical protein